MPPDRAKMAELERIVRERNPKTREELWAMVDEISMKKFAGCDGHAA